jgi:hypothetical protein
VPQSGFAKLHGILAETEESRIIDISLAQRLYGHHLSGIFKMLRDWGKVPAVSDLFLSMFLLNIYYFSGKT